MTLMTSTVHIVSRISSAVAERKCRGHGFSVDSDAARDTTAAEVFIAQLKAQDLKSKDLDDNRKGMADFIVALTTNP